MSTVRCCTPAPMTSSPLDHAARCTRDDDEGDYSRSTVVLYAGAVGGGAHVHVHPIISYTKFQTLFPTNSYYRSPVRAGRTPRHHHRPTSFSRYWAQWGAPRPHPPHRPGFERSRAVQIVQRDPDSGKRRTTASGRTEAARVRPFGGRGANEEGAR